MKKKTIQPRIGKGGKYLSIFKTILYSTGKISDPVGQEKLLREWTANPDVPGLSASYEKLALFIIENEGHHFKKPYDYLDMYEKENGFHGIVGKIKAEIGTEYWNMTYAGRAAEILDSCQDLRSYMEGGNITKIAHYAMLLQMKVGHLIIMPLDLPANIGANIILERQKAAQKGAAIRKDAINDRNNKIIELFEAGKSTSIISKQFEIGIREVQRIVKPCRKK